MYKTLIQRAFERTIAVSDARPGQVIEIVSASTGYAVGVGNQYRISSYQDLLPNRVRAYNAGQTLVGLAPQNRCVVIEDAE